MIDKPENIRHNSIEDGNSMKEWEEWKNTKITVTLTNGEWGTVEYYLLSEINNIKDHLERLGTGVPRDYWLEQISNIQEIRKKIQERS